MKVLLKYILIALFCISTIKNDCTGTEVTESVCTTDPTCKWNQTVAGACSNSVCSAETSSGPCKSHLECAWDAAVGCVEDNPVCSGSASADACGKDCKWAEAKGTCTTKTCADYTTESPCNNVATCEWSNNACSTKSTTTEGNGVFGLKSSILIFLSLFLF